jgi:protein-S-isoprenylcysteine O-methyltransferase Ste14
MDTKSKKPISPLRVAVMLLLVIVILPFLPILVSWRWQWWEAWVFGGIWAVGFIVSRLLLARRNPDLIAERANYAQHHDAKSWDKVLSPLVAIGSGLIPLTAGLDARFGHPPIFPIWVELTALALIILSYVGATWALLENRFFSGMVRIQTDRGHSVVSTGPYAIVRHPGYASSLVTFLAIPFFLDSWWAIVPAVIFIVVLFIRTALEDRTLRAELPGYTEYTHRTRFRLIPGIW